MKWVTTVVLLFFWGVLEGSQHYVFEGPKGSSVVVEIPKEKVVLGETVDVSVVINYPKGYAPAVEELAVHLLSYFGPKTPPFRLASMHASAPEAKGADAIVSQHIDFVLAPQRSGEFFPSLLNVVFVPEDPKDLNALEIVTGLFKVEVVEPANKAVDAVGLLAPGFPLNTPYSLVGLGVAREAPEERVRLNKETIESRSIPWVFLLSCMALAGVFWLIRHMAVREAVSVPRPVDVEEARREALEGLKVVVKEGAQREGIAEIDAVMRTYFDEAYRIDAQHLTSKEILEDMAEANRFDDETVKEMSHFFGHLDTAKYAPVKIPSEEAQKLASVATKIITTLKH